MVDNVVPLVGIFIHSGDIRDQSVKLREITPHFEQFLLSNILGGVTVPPKLYPRYHACLAARHLEKFGEVAPPAPKL